MPDNILGQISSITEFNDIKEFMQDPDLDEALDLIIKFIAKPDVPSVAAQVAIIRLQALSAKFQLQAKYYTVLEKGEVANKKKNIYYTASEALDKLVSAVKYSMR